MLPKPETLSGARTARWIIACLVAFFSMSCSAASSCPWLNTPTASGFLGGAATVTVTDKNGMEATAQNLSQDTENVTCDFVRVDGTKKYSLHIAVKTMVSANKEFPVYEKQCIPPKTALKGIGNEAIACTLPDTAGKIGQIVIGRVRDQAFLVILSTNTPNDSLWTSSYLRDKSEDIAEQVAGNLF